MANSFTMSLLHKTNGLPSQRTLAFIKFIKMEPHNDESKSNVSNTLQMEAHLTETPQNCHLVYMSRWAFYTQTKEKKNNFMKINNDM